MLETREADYESARSAILRAAAQRKTIDVSDNRLASLPPEIGRLNNLSSLDVSNNRLTHLPAEIGQLTNLDALSLGDNQIANLPAEIGRLARLKLLDLVGNDLALLPPELSQLSDTVELRLAHNDLIEPLPELLARGIPTLLAYLRGVLESGAPVYEAKVLVVGEGNVGTGVRIIIVATHASERRREELDHSPLKRQFGDLLVDHCEVDNLAPTGIRSLRRAVAAEAAKFPHMGGLLSRHWLKARDEVMARLEPHIPYHEFAAVRPARPASGA